MLVEVEGIENVLYLQPTLQKPRRKNCKQALQISELFLNNQYQLSAKFCF